ncbi:MAG TPA: hypothetical protein VGO16_01160 [Pseudonocardiaceae bacterium]|nr:hypothetical protein [Pseudonocardiaceae bacterium]
MLPPLVVALVVVAAGLDVARAVRPLLSVMAASVTGLWVITIGLGAAQHNGLNGRTLPSQQVCDHREDPRVD